jgi:long-subunit acyl-CoA synthetase (AMP-forming)
MKSLHNFTISTISSQHKGPTHPPAELDYVLSDSKATHVIVDPTLMEHLPKTRSELKILPVPVIDEQSKQHLVQDDVSLNVDDAALLVYTSGTTCKLLSLVSHSQI